MNKLFYTLPYIVGKGIKEQIKNNKEKTINNTSINDQKQQGIISSQEARNKIPENTRNSVDEFFNAYKLNGPEKKKENNNINLNRNSFNNNSNNSLNNNFLNNFSNKLKSNRKPFQENENTGLKNNQLNNLEGSTNEVKNLDYGNNNSKNDNTRIKAIRFPKIHKIKTEEIKNNLQQTNPQRNIKSGTNLTNTNTTNNNQTLTPKYFNTGEKYIPTKGEQEAGDWLVMNGLFGDREEQERLRKEYREKENNNDNEKNNQREQTYKRFTKEEKNPNYESYKETEKYYKDIGLNYNFKINTNSEYYDKNKAIVKQENIINILGNKDLLHEVELYPNGEEFKRDKNGKYLLDENGKKIKNDSIKMYQVREEGDTGGKHYSDAERFEEKFRGQCTYLVSKVLKQVFPEYLTGKYPKFDVPVEADKLINTFKAKENEFDITKIPSIGAIYADTSGSYGHVALVTDVEVDKDGDYTFTVLEQNSIIERDGVEYFPPSNTNGSYGIDRKGDADYSMVIGVRKVQMTKKELENGTINFITRK